MSRPAGAQWPPEAGRPAASAWVPPAEPAITSFIAGGADRLDRAIVRAVPALSRAAAQRLIEQAAVTVDGLAAKSASRPRPGAVISVAVPAPCASELQPEAMPLVIVYEDTDMIVLDKPAGVVVHPGPGHASGTLVHGLLAGVSGLSGIGGVERPGIVHRLDRDTSGLLMVAKNDRAHRSLSAQLAARSVRKHYLALLVAPPKPGSGIIDAPIGRDLSRRGRMAIVAGGRAARTAYLTLAVAGRRTLVAARLESGRTHQLRVHFASLGCPITGDPVYGLPAAGPGGRMWLHAWRLRFERPSDGTPITLEAQVPAELQAGWQDADAAAQRSASFEGLLDRARRWAQGAEAAQERHEKV